MSFRNAQTDTLRSAGQVDDECAIESHTCRGTGSTSLARHASRSSSVRERIRIMMASTSEDEGDVRQQQAMRHQQQPQQQRQKAGASRRLVTELGAISSDAARRVQNSLKERSSEAKNLGRTLATGTRNANFHHVLPAYKPSTPAASSTSTIAPPSSSSVRSASMSQDSQPVQHIVGLDLEARVGDYVRVLNAKLARFVEPTGYIVEVRCEGERVRVQHDGDGGELRYYNTGKHDEFDLALINDQGRAFATASCTFTRDPTVRVGIESQATMMHGVQVSAESHTGTSRRGVLPPAPHMLRGTDKDDARSRCMTSTEARVQSPSGFPGQWEQQQRASPHSTSAACTPRLNYVERRKAQDYLQLVESPLHDQPSIPDESISQPSAVQGKLATARNSYDTMRLSRVPNAASNCLGVYERMREASVASKECADSPVEAIAARQAVVWQKKTHADLEAVKTSVLAELAREGANAKELGKLRTELRNEIEAIEQRVIAEVLRQAAGVRELDTLREDMRRQFEAMEQSITDSLLTEVEKRIQQSIGKATEKILAGPLAWGTSSICSLPAAVDHCSWAPEPEQESHPADDVPDASDAADRAERAKKAALEAAAAAAAAAATAVAATGPPRQPQAEKWCPSQHEQVDASSASRRQCAAMAVTDSRSSHNQEDESAEDAYRHQQQQSSVSRKHRATSSSGCIRAKKYAHTQMQPHRYPSLDARGTAEGSTSSTKDASEDVADGRTRQSQFALGGTSGVADSKCSIGNGSTSSIHASDYFDPCNEGDDGRADFHPFAGAHTRRSVLQTKACEGVGPRHLGSFPDFPSARRNAREQASSRDRRPAKPFSTAPGQARQGIGITYNAREHADSNDWDYDSVTDEGPLVF